MRLPSGLSPLTDRRVAYLLVGLIAAGIYLNALGNQFAYDDVHIVVQNTVVQSLDSLPDALTRPWWPGSYGRELGLWRPASTAALSLQYAASDGDPWLFHTVNVILHVIASLLVLALLYELLSAAAALAGGLVFAVHPVHVEAVANVVGLAEILSTTCIVAACLVHVRSGERSGWGASLAVGLLYLVGFGAKEGGVVLPGLIFLLDAARREIDFRQVPAYLARRWKVYVVMLVVSIGLLWGRYTVLGSLADPFAPLGASLLHELPRIWTLGEVWIHYVRLWVFPLDLSADYSPGVIPISFGWNVENVLGVALALVIMSLSWLAWRRPTMAAGRDTGRAAAFGVVWFVIAISPISNTIFLSGILLAERTLYLPSVGLAAATGWLVVRLARERKRLAWAGLVVVVLASSVRVWTRNPSWRDTGTMLEAMIRDVPYSGRSQWVLGDQFLIGGRVSQALVSYRAAIDLLGTHYALLTEISKRLMGQGYFRAADGLLRVAIQERPDYPLAYALLALVRAEFGDAESAEHYARRAVAIAPDDMARHHLLAWALAAQGRMEEATRAREVGDSLGTALFWMSYMYVAHERWEAGDTAEAYVAIDSAYVWVSSDLGRATLDSIKVADFGFEPTGERRETVGEGGSEATSRGGIPPLQAADPLQNPMPTGHVDRIPGGDRRP